MVPTRSKNIAVRETVSKNEAEKTYDGINVRPLTTMRKNRIIDAMVQSILWDLGRKVVVERIWCGRGESPPQYVYGERCTSHINSKNSDV